jgi:alkanesulfonate monooxygenase SsuD/methylene tetrahydromethanopterin reductase-like flavin-dependent oxidoreductase (luciferase family)
VDRVETGARVALAVDQVSFGCVAPAARSDVAALESAGARSLWVGGHIASRNPSPEALSWLARLCEQVDDRTLVGTAVLLLPLYPPAIVAKMIADLDNVTGGRIALGVGVGGEYPGEFEAAQVPLAERGKRMDEAIALLRRFWTGEEISWDGPLFAMNSVRIHPAPAQPGGPPIVVAGRQPVAMRRAARLADGWMPYLFSARRYAESVATVRAEAEAIGRSLDGFGWLAYLPVSMDDDANLARRRAAEFLGGTYKQDFDAMLDRVAVTGTPDDVARKLQEFVDAGARHLILLPAVRENGTRMLTRILTEIAPAVGQGTAGQASKPSRQGPAMWPPSTTSDDPVQ